MSEQLSEQVSDPGAERIRWMNRAGVVAVVIAVAVAGFSWSARNGARSVATLTLEAEDAQRAAAAADAVVARAKASGLPGLSARVDGASVRLEWPDRVSNVQGEPPRDAITDADVMQLVGDGPSVRPVLEALDPVSDADRPALQTRRAELRAQLGLEESSAADELVNEPSLQPGIDRNSAEFRELVRIERRLSPAGATVWRMYGGNPLEVVAQDLYGRTLRLGPELARGGDWDSASVSGSGDDTVLNLSAKEGPARERLSRCDPAADPNCLEVGPPGDTAGTGPLAQRVAVLNGAKVVGVADRTEDGASLTIKPVDARVAFLMERIVANPLPTRLGPPAPEGTAIREG